MAFDWYSKTCNLLGNVIKIVLEKGKENNCNKKRYKEASLNDIER